MNDLSFVIRSRNEERWIGHAIQSVIDFCGEMTEIIIVDNDSKDQTLEVVNLFPKRYTNIKVLSISQKDYTPGKALNVGIANTSKSCKTVGLLSSHCRITEFDKELIDKKLYDENYFAIFGKQLPIYRGKRSRMRYVWSNFDVSNAVVNPIELIPEKRCFFHNAFSFIRKDIWEKESFDEDLAGKEDRYWAEKLVLKNMSFLLDPNLKCEHYWTEKGATWKD